MPGSVRRGSIGTIVALIASLGLAGTAVVLAGQRLGAEWASRVDSVKVIPDLRSGRQWQVVVIGSSTCAAARSAEIRQAIREIIGITRSQAHAAGDLFSSLGVAIDWNIDNGQRFLESIGTFDEISLGGSWLNQTSVRLMVRDQPSIIGTPEVITLVRTIRMQGPGLSVSNDSLVKRLVGGEEIIKFRNAIRVSVTP
jgi:hypothetical protein